MRVAARTLRDGHLTRLSALTRSRSVRAGIAQRARIIVLASEGESNTRIAELAGVTRQTADTWRARYDEAGMNGLVDEARSRRPRTIDHRKIV